MMMQHFVIRPVGSAGEGGAAPVMSGLWAWHDAADSASITEETGGRVVDWADKSGNGRDAVMASGATARPYSGARSLNGLNVLDFRGDQRLELPTGEYLGAGDNTVFIVYQADATSHAYLLSGRSGSVANVYEIAVNTASNGIFRARHNTAASYTQWSGGAALDAHIGMLRRDGATAEVALDGDIKASVAASNLSLNGNMLYGVRFDGSSYLLPYDGVIAEVLLYDRALNSGEVAENLAYLQEKWGL